MIVVLGVVLGSYLATKLTKAAPPKNNTIWERAYGPSKVKRNLWAFIGGILLMLGARLADGCTSGHAISGGAQLSITSWIFMCFVFATAIPTAFILYKK